MTRFSILRERGQRGYIMLVALVVMAIIAAVGATSLSIAGVDQRIALHNRKYMMMMNTAFAGTDHARNRLETIHPSGENLDSGFGSDSSTDGLDTERYFVTRTTGNDLYQGSGFGTESQNFGVYWVEAIYLKCGLPPPGYSTEAGPNGFRSDYWAMSATSRMMDVSGSDSYQNNAEGRAVSVVRNVQRGSCKIR